MSIENEDVLQNIRDTQAELKALGRVTNNVNTQVRRVSGEGLQHMIKALEDISVHGKTAQSVLQKFSEKMFKTILDQASKQFETGTVLDEGQSKEGLAQSLLGGIFGNIAQERNSNSLQVTVINNTQAQIQTQEQVGQNGQRQLQIMVDNMVADSLVKGSATQNVLNHVFGLTQQLVTR